MTQTHASEVHTSVVTEWPPACLHKLLPRGHERGNIGYPSKKHLKPKSREISFAHYLFPSYTIILKFCTEHGGITVVLCAKFQNDWTADTNVLDERDLARFEFKMGCGRINHHKVYFMGHFTEMLNGLVQVCSISSELAMEILQLCTEPSKYQCTKLRHLVVNIKNNTWKNDTQGRI